MIRLFFSDVGALSEETTINIYNKAPALAGVIPSLSGAGFYDSARAYTALLEAVRQTLRDEPRLVPKMNGTPCGADLTLTRDECGKPRFARLPLYFNISHRGDAVAIALSDDREVGVDIEGEIAPERASKIESRFLEGFLPEQRKTEGLEMFHLALSQEGYAEISRIYPDKENNSLHIREISPSSGITPRWTALEALIKMSGGGFGDYPRRDELLSTSRLSSYEVGLNSAVYAVTLAIPDSRG